MPRQFVQRLSFWLLAVSASLGLLTVTPVNCICPPGDHLGLAVHSLLPHQHTAEAHKVDPGPGWQHSDRSLQSQAIIADDASDAETPMLVAAGLALLAAYLASLAQSVNQRRWPAIWRPAEYLGAPPRVPPRRPLIFASSR